MSVSNLISQIQGSRNKLSMPTPDQISAAKREARDSGDLNLINSIDSALKEAEERIKKEEAAQEKIPDSFIQVEEKKFSAGEAVDKYFAREDIKLDTAFINKVNSGTRINDNDPSGKSLNTQEVIERFTNISSPKNNKERLELSSALISETKGLEKKEAAAELTTQEKERLEKNREQGSKLVEHAITSAIVANRPEGTTIEDFVKNEGNRALDRNRFISNVTKEIMGDDHYKGMVAIVAKINLVSEIEGLENPMQRLRKVPRAQPKNNTEEIIANLQNNVSVSDTAVPRNTNNSSATLSR